MPLHQCSRCVKIYDADFDDDSFICPFCRDRVKPYSGPTPPSLSEAKLKTPELPILPLPEISPISYKFIRLTNRNYSFWDSYVRLMRYIASNVFEGKQRESFQQAVKGFLDALDCFNETPAGETWIACATFGSLSDTPSAKSFVKIEMCMTVTTHPDIPISTHMGIFRSPLRLIEVPALDKAKHLTSGGISVADIIKVMERNEILARPVRNLSVQLHAFAAKRCLQESSGSRKIYMITAPLGKMLEILKDKCGSFATEKITSSKTDNVLVVQVGDTKSPKSQKISIVNIPHYVWLTKLVGLEDERPKIAIELEPLASSMDESTRVESVLDWLDKWRRGY